MTRFFNYSVSIALFVLLCLSLVTNWDKDLVILLNVLVLLNLLNNLGDSIVLREIVALYTAFSCLLMPYLGYEVYNRSNDMAVLWQRFMPVSADVFFNYTFPAVTGYILALTFPLGSSYNDRGEKLLLLMDRVKWNMIGHHKYGVILIVSGIIITTFVNFLPISLQFFFNLLYFSSFAGLLYVYYSKPFPLRKLIMVGFAMFILLSALKQGMFTIVVYMGMTLFPFFFLGRRVSLLRKVSLFFVGVFIVGLIQSVKPAYRIALWKNKYEGNRVELFTDLISDKLSHPKTLFHPNEFFFIYYRTNQGFNHALVMKHMPAKRSFDNGQNLFISIFSAFVPRVFWPDKPEAGGKANMKYYTGYTIKGWATNVGPLGEAYGSFGLYGGILYMMILGLVVRWFFGRIFILSRKAPLVLLWMPVLFYQVSYSAENDTLQIFNSLIKTGIFMFILFKLFPTIFIPSVNMTRSARGGRQLVTNLAN